MAIRKHGQATGEVTGVDEGDRITREAAARPAWDERDDRDLAAENERADQDPGDDD